MSEKKNKAQESKKYIFEEMPEIRAVLNFAIPTIISQLINVIYNMADTIFVGRTGNPYMIGGVSLSFPIFIFTVSIANLLGIGGGSLISRKMGRGQETEAKSVAAFSLYASLLAAILYVACNGLFMEPILNAFGASENTMLYAKQYTTWVVVVGGIPAILSSVEAHLLRNVGYSSQASWGLSGGGILNILLDPLFMFVLFPEGQEVLAAAIATCVSNLCAFIFLTFQFVRVSRKTPLSANPALVKELKKADAREVFSIGIPSALLPGLFDLANIVLNSSMAAHGDLELAALGIVMKIERIPNAMNIGLSQGMLPLVAYNFSSGNHERMRKLIHKTRMMGLAISCLFIVVFEISAKSLVGMFLSVSGSAADAAATIAFASVFLRLRVLGSPFQFINYHSSYAMQAMGDGRGTLLHAFIRIIILYIPCMYLLDALFGASGLAASLPVGEALSDIVALLLITRWVKKHEK